MDVLTKGSTDATVHLTRDELYMLLQALSEVCHGYAIPESEFETRMGWPRQAYETLCDQVLTAFKTSN